MQRYCILVSLGKGILMLRYCCDEECAEALLRGDVAAVFNVISVIVFGDTPYDHTYFRAAAQQTMSNVRNDFPFQSMNDITINPSN